MQERCFVLIEAVAQANGLVLLAAGYAVLQVLLKLVFFLFSNFAVLWAVYSSRCAGAEGRGAA